MRLSYLSSTALALLIGISAAAAADTPPAAAKVIPYTLSTCIVSGDKLDGGDMGEAITKVYGDREIKFCCKGCIKKFEKDQAGYLKKIDDAVAATPAKPGTTAPAAPVDKH